MSKIKFNRKSVLVIALIVIGGIFVGSYIIAGYKDKHIKELEALNYGGVRADKYIPAWQKTPDKTEELYPKFVKEVNASFPETVFTVTKNEGVKVPFHEVRAKEGTDRDEFREEFRKTYIKYRDQGYKGCFILYIGDKIAGTMPPMQL